MKAILVVDLIGDYNLDKLKVDSQIRFRYDNTILSAYFNQELKTMPQKMKVNYDYIATCEVTEKVVAMGWNACISAILGEEEK